MTTLGERIGGSKRVIGGPFGSNLTQADYTSKGIPVIRGSNMEQGGRWLGGDFAFVSSEKATDLRSNLAKPGDIIVTQRGTMGQVSIIPDDSAVPEWVISQSQMAISVDSRCAFRDFVYYYLKSPQFAEYLSQSIIQVGVPHINLGILRQVPADWPSLDVQRLIAWKLTSLDEKIELNRQMNETLEAMAQAIFRDWFIDFGPVRRKQAGAADPIDVMGPVTADPTLSANLAALFPSEFSEKFQPKGWSEVGFLQAAKLISGGTPKTDRAEFWGGPVAWASAKDVSQCGEAFLLSTERSITELGLRASSTKIVPKYSTVVVARGATTGRFCMFGRDIAMNQTCYAIESRWGAPFWLNRLFASRVSDLVQGAHGSVFDTITTNTFERAAVLRPPQELITHFEKWAQPIFLRMLAALEENRTLAETRDYLLPRLMSGEIRVAEAAEMAEAAA